MSEKNLDREELLRDSEATLREVAGILLELWDGSASSDGNGASGGNGGVPNGKAVSELVGVLMRTYQEIHDVLNGIRKGRGILHQAAMERVKKTHAKLEEVTMTTELAATDMLDGLDKALSLVDQVFTADEETAMDEERRAQAGEELRDELQGLVVLLQFQDITAQQLAHAAGVLAEVEERLEGLMRLFNLHHLDLEDEVLKMGFEDKEETDSPTFDPAATTRDSENRQALADEIFTRP